MHTVESVLGKLAAHEFLHPVTLAEAERIWADVPANELDEQASEVFRVLDLIAPAMEPVAGADGEPRPSLFAEHVADMAACDGWDAVDATVFGDVEAEDGSDRFEWWYHRTFATRLTPPRSLSAAANAFALMPSSKSDLVGELYWLAGQSLRFVSGGGVKVGLELLEEFLMLTEHSYVDPVVLIEHINGRFQHLDICRGDTKANVLFSLAESLRFASGRGESAASVLWEGFLALDGDSYREAATLRGHLDTRFGVLGVEVGATKANVLLSLSNALRFVSGRGDSAAAALLEGFLGLSGHSYGDPATLKRQCDDRFKKLGIADGNVQANVLLSLSSALRFVSGRGDGAAAMLLEWFLGLNYTSYGNPSTLKRQLDDRFDELHIESGVTQAGVLYSLAAALRNVSGRGAHAASVLLEGFLGLDGDSYSHTSTLKRHLDDRFTELGIESGHTRLGVLVSLADSLQLNSNRGSVAAVTLWEAFLGLGVESYSEAAKLKRHLDARFHELRTEHGTTQVSVLVSLAEPLRFVSDHGAGAASVLLEGFLGLGDMSYSNPVKLKRELDDRFEELCISDDGINLTNILTTLAEALRQLDDRMGDAATLLLAGLDLNAETLTAVELQQALANKQISHIQNGIEYLMSLGNVAGVGSDVALEAAKACQLLVLGVLDPHSGNSIQERLDFLAGITSVAPFYRRVGLAHMAKSPEKKRELAKSMSWWLRNVQNRGLVLRLIDGTAKSMNRPKIVSETELTTSKWPFNTIDDENNQAWNEDVNRAWRTRLQTDFDNNIVAAVYSGDWLGSTQQLCLEARPTGDKDRIG